MFVFYCCRWRSYCSPASLSCFVKRFQFSCCSAVVVFFSLLLSDMLCFLFYQEVLGDFFSHIRDTVVAVLSTFKRKDERKPGKLIGAYNVL